MCRCAERRAALGRAIDATRRGNVNDVRSELRSVATSLAEDLRIAEARAALARLQWRGRLGAQRR
jgi:hypothetical protein